MTGGFDFAAHALWGSGTVSDPTRSGATTLTMDAILDARAKLGDPLPRLRLVVGFPGVGQRILHHEPLGLFALSAEMFEELKKHATPVQPAHPFGVTSIFGMTVEYYDANDPDHRRFLYDMQRLTALSGSRGE